MKPYHVFLTFLSLLLIIALIAYFFPTNGIRIAPDVVIQFPSLKELTREEQKEYKDISDIVDNIPPIDTLAPVIEDTLAQAEADTVRTGKDTIPPQPRDTLKRKPSPRPQLTDNPLQYPNDDPAVLYPFFRSLQDLKDQDRIIRILHYGDSQIEGDRISSYIRNQLQKEFGGAGIGLTPVVLPHNTHISLRHSATKNWIRYTPRNINDANFKHRRFGALMSFSRFSSYYSHYQDDVHEASITIRESPITFNLNNAFTRCRVFFGYNNKPFIVKMNYADETADADMVPARDTLTEISWEIPPSVKEFTLTFQGNHSPDVYAMALDGERGIALDNIPLRGSSGTRFTRTDTLFLKQMIDRLQVKLIIMHFGVNLVPLVRDNYAFYEQRFYEQLRMFKSISDSVNIIVMGVTDMSQKTGGDYRSYPNIEKIRDAQKNAAFRANCAFWDTYQAMGGKNSMPSWVFANPPLARKDFTHFTYKGSVVIAKMFYKALMKDYHTFLLNRKKPQHPTIRTKEDST
jgi:hypothetical protein